MKPCLYKAVRSGDVDFLRRIREGPDGDVVSNQYFNQKTPKENNILHIAAEFKHIVFFSDLIPLQSPLFWALNKRGDTPLHVAARVGCDQIVEFLIQHSNRADEERGLVEGTEAHNNELLRMTNLEDDTALHIAARYGFHRVVNLLMQADSQLSCFTNKANESPLFIATSQGFLLIANAILNQCPNSVSSFQGINGVTALHTAITHLDQQSQGMWFSCTPSEPAALQLVKNMVLKNPDLVKEGDALGWTPLHYAAFKENLEATRVLLMNPSDESEDSACYLLDKSGMAALHVAAYAGHMRIMEELIQYRPDCCDLLNYKGQTALHVAVLGEKINAVKWILQKPELAGLINEPDKDGNTPLHLAAINKNRDITVILTQDPRVDRNAINKEFFKAIDIFRGNNTQEETDSLEDDMNYLKEYIQVFFKGVDDLRSLERSISVPYFQQQINRNFSYESPEKEKDMSSTPAAIVDNKLLDNAPQRRQSRLLVAALIATVTFAAGFTVPGGLNTSNGRPLLEDNIFFTFFLCTNAFSFYLSILVIFFELVDRDFLAVPIVATLLRGSLAGMVEAFFFGLFAMLTSKNELQSKEGNTYFNLELRNILATLVLPFVILCLFLRMLVVTSTVGKREINIRDRVI